MSAKRDALLAREKQAVTWLFFFGLSIRNLAEAFRVDEVVIEAALRENVREA